MMYKSVFFGYIAAAIAVVSALLLILIMHHQDRQYESRKLMPLAGLVIGSIFMNTLYFLSFFDSLTTLQSFYRPYERGMDILCSFVINMFLLIFLYHSSRETSAAARKLFRPALVLLICAFLFACIVYVVFVTEEYRVSPGHLILVEVAQSLLTVSIVLITAVYTWLTVRAMSGERETETAASVPATVDIRVLRRLIVALGIVNIVTALYNAVGSMALFQNRFYYKDWGGVNDMNTWLFLLSDILVLMIVGWYYRAQTAEGAPASAQGEEQNIPETLGLTPREEEITRLILQRFTYREIAEKLVISEHTVKRHIHNIYTKAGVSRRDELIRKLDSEIQDRLDPDPDTQNPPDRDGGGD